MPLCNASDMGLVLQEVGGAGIRQTYLPLRRSGLRFYNKAMQRIQRRRQRKKGRQRFFHIQVRTYLLIHTRWSNMDPVSILSIVGATLSVATGVTKAIGTLSGLKSRYRNVPLQLSTLIGQLYIVQTALEQISSWSSTDLFGRPRYRQLASQIGTSLDSFRPLMLALQHHLDELASLKDIDMTVMKKVSFLWNEQDLMAYSSLLDHQVNALTLFLQAIQW